MRVFTSLSNAESEIRRDLTRANKVPVLRVQNRAVAALTVSTEALDYTYTLEASAVPESPEDLIDFGRAHFSWMGSAVVADQLQEWLVLQTLERQNLQGLKPRENPSDLRHPLLRGLEPWPSYTYRERMVGMVDEIVNILLLDPFSRRAWWPIFHPGDSFRSSGASRVPCTLGYWFNIREVFGRSRFLGMTSVMRSMDFEHFWLTDVYLAVMLQREVLRRLKAIGQANSDLNLGWFTHQVLSFHYFSEDTEVY